MSPCPFAVGHPSPRLPQRDSWCRRDRLRSLPMVGRQESCSRAVVEDDGNNEISMALMRFVIDVEMVGDVRLPFWAMYFFVAVGESWFKNAWRGSFGACHMLGDAPRQWYRGVCKGDRPS